MTQIADHQGENARHLRTLWQRISAAAHLPGYEHDHIRHEMRRILPNLEEATIGVVPFSPEQPGFHRESAHHRHPAHA